MIDEHLRALRGRMPANRISTDHDVVVAASRDFSVPSRKKAQVNLPATYAAAVVRVENTVEVSDVMRWANERNISIVVRGGGSGTVGSGVPGLGDGVILDLDGLDHVGEINSYDRLITVGAGIKMDVLENHLVDHGLTAGHYPQSLALASVGGCVAMRGTGTWSSLHGNIEDRVADLTVVLADGQVVQTRSLPRASTGPDLKQLFIGSEGTLGVITEVTLKLAHLPEARRYASYTFDSMQQAIDTVREILALGIAPGVVRIYDPIEATAGHAAFIKDPAWLLVLVFDGATTIVEAQAVLADQIATKHGGTSTGKEPARLWEQRRFDYSWVDKAAPTLGGVADSIEVSAPWSALERIHSEASAAVGQLMPTVMAHVSHVYADGAALYIIFGGDFSTVDEGLTAHEQAWAAVMEATLSNGGRISHHHGIGTLRAPYMERELGAGLGILRSLKSTLDPESILNPGKMGL